MRVVLDTNVLVSGIFFTGPPNQILRTFSQGKFRLITTLEISEEYQHEGSSHSIYVNRPARNTSTVPRHREINDFLARKICRDLYVADPDA